MTDAGAGVSEGAVPEASRSEPVSSHTATRQQILYCPYCAEETLFPLERGWECRSCGRAFSITFLGLRPTPGRTEET
jgi:ribosomal protein L37AE/L43A